MIKFDEHIGETIFIFPKHPIKMEDTEPRIYGVKLVGVDLGGIWFEHEDATQRLISEMKASGLQVQTEIPKVLAFFVPYSELYFAFVVATKIDEQSLGV
jgi:hypothetical protein